MIITGITAKMVTAVMATTVMSNEQQVKAYIARHILEKKYVIINALIKDAYSDLGQPASRSAIDAQLTEIAELLPV